MYCIAFRIEIKNETSKKYEEKTEFFYEMHYMLEFFLHDDNDLILATTLVEAKRSTTSGKFISLNEKENIVDTLILDTLIGVSLKSEELLKNTNSMKNGVKFMDEIKMRKIQNPDFKVRLRYMASSKI